MRVSFDEINSGTITSASHIGKQIAAAAKGAVCGLNDFLDTLAPQFDPVGLRRAVLNDLCGNPTPPGSEPPGAIEPPPPSCGCVAYDVAWNWNIGFSPTSRRSGVSQVWGDIKSFEYRPENATFSNPSIGAVCRGGTGDPCLSTYEYVVFDTTSGGSSLTGDLQITSVTRADGLPNICTPEQQPERPPSLPALPDIPPIVVISDFGKFEFRPVFNFDVNLNVDFPRLPSLQTPNFEINIGDNYFDIDFNFPRNGGGGDGGFNNEDRKRLRAAEDAAKRAAGNTTPPPPPDDDEWEPEERPPEEKDKETPAGTRWVLITITQRPKSNKIQFGEGAPDILYCGWLEFKVENNYWQRSPIWFDQTLFLLPKEAQGYAYTLTNGAEGFATFWKPKET